MSTSLFSERVGRLLTLVCLFLLPWQTRYIFWAPWIGTTESEFGVISLYVTMLLALTAAVAWLIVEVRRDTYTKKQLAIFGVTTSCLIAVFVTTYPSPAHAWILNGAFSLLLGYATYKTAHQSSRATIYAVFAGLVPALGLGIWQMVAGWSPASSWLGLASRSAEHLGDSVIIIEGQRILRMYGSFPHPNIFGTAIALIFSVAVTVSSRAKREILKNQVQESRRSLTTFEMTGKPRLLVAIPVLIAVVLFCISRSAALAMACALIAYLGLSYKNTLKRRALFLIALFFPVLIWTLQFISPSLLALRGQSFAEQQSISERVAQMGEWWQVMEQNGIWGTGIYYYPQAIADIQGASLPAWAYQPVHNVFLLVIAELGLFWCAVIVIGACVILKEFFVDRRIFQFPNFITSLLPFFITLFSLSYFDHALWTSWSGMSYMAVAIALVFADGQSRISTLSQGVLDEKK